MQRVATHGALGLFDNSPKLTPEYQQLDGNHLFVLFFFFFVLIVNVDLFNH